MLNINCSVCAIINSGFIKNTPLLKYDFALGQVMFPDIQTDRRNTVCFPTGKLDTVC